MNVKQICVAALAALTLMGCEKQNPFFHYKEINTMMANLMCQLGYALVPRCLVKHYSRCCYETILHLK